MRHRPRVWILSAALLGVALLVHEPLRRGALTVLRLPFSALRFIAAALVVLPRLPSLTHERAALSADVARLRLDLAQAQEALRRMEQADALRGLASSRSAVTASVIGRSLLPTQHTVLLDRGERQGVVRGSVVLDAAGVAGRVVDVQPASSLVLLLTDPESRVAGVVERSRETGLLVGRGRGMCELIYLQADADVAEGDLILTAGFGGDFPKGLRLGTVVRVARDEQEGTTTASVKPAAQLHRLEDVLCLKPQAPAP